MRSRAEGPGRRCFFILSGVIFFAGLCLTHTVSAQAPGPKKETTVPVRTAAVMGFVA